MSIARIITRSPESTENLAAYLRGRGYEVVYAHPDALESSAPEPRSLQSTGEDLSIEVYPCLSRAEALTRAHEIAASSNCDVFVGEGVVDVSLGETRIERQAVVEERSGAPQFHIKAPPQKQSSGKQVGFYKPEALDAIEQRRAPRFYWAGLNVYFQVVRSVGARTEQRLRRARRHLYEAFRLAIAKASRTLEEFEQRRESRAAKLRERHQERRRSAQLAKERVLRLKALREMAKPRHSTGESPTRQYDRDWKVLFTGSAVAALLLLFVVRLFMSHAPASVPVAPQAGRGVTASKNPPSSRLTIVQPRPEPRSLQTFAGPDKAVVAAAPAAVHPAFDAKRTVLHTEHHRSIPQPEAEQEVTIRYFNRPDPHAAAKTRAGVKHYSDLD